MNFISSGKKISITSIIVFGESIEGKDFGGSSRSPHLRHTVNGFGEDYSSRMIVPNDAIVGEWSRNEMRLRPEQSPRYLPKCSFAGAPESNMMSNAVILQGSMFHVNIEPKC